MDLKPKIRPTPTSPPLLPHGGFLSFDSLVTFEWTPHAGATSYAIDIKHLGQETYPLETEQSRIVTPSAEQTSSGKITHSLNLTPGDYEWCITALNSAQEPLQSTEDRIYQIQSQQ